MVIIPNCRRPEVRMGQEQGGRTNPNQGTGRQDNQDVFVSLEPLEHHVMDSCLQPYTNGKLSKLAELFFLHLAHSASQGDMEGCGRHERHDQHGFGDD